MTPIIRQATLADYPTIAQLHSISWLSAYRGIFTDHFLDIELDGFHTNRWKSRFTEDTQNLVVYLLEIEQVAIGFIAIFLNFDEKYGSLIDNLHVLPKYKGQGFGKLLMQYAAKQLVTQYNFNHYHLWVLEKNYPSVKFYDAMGGQAVQHQKYLMPDSNEHVTYRYYWPDLSGFVG